MLASDVVPKAQRVKMIEDWQAAENIDAVVKLFVNDIHPDDHTVVGDFIEPTGSWYTPQAVTYGQTRETEDGGLTQTAASLQYDYTGVSAAEVVRGYFVVNVTPGHLLSSARLDTPVNMANTLDSVIVQPQITLPPVPAV